MGRLGGLVLSMIMTNPKPASGVLRPDAIGIISVDRPNSLRVVYQQRREACLGSKWGGR